MTQDEDVEQILEIGVRRAIEFIRLGRLAHARFALEVAGRSAESLIKGTSCQN